MTTVRIRRLHPVGGFVTVLAGIVGASVPTVALGLAGSAGIAVAYLGGRTLLVGDFIRLGSVAMVGGVGVAAILVGAFAVLNLFLALGTSTVGAGVFVSGFLLYIVVWGTDGACVGTPIQRTVLLADERSLSQPERVDVLSKYPQIP